ncbi:MAG: YcbK family protein [Elainellaceae cyanobacterium]
MVQKFLRVTRDTLFKLRPEQSSKLTDEEVFSVKAGTTYEIQSYAYADADGDFNGHIKFALENDSIRGLNTWFVYDAHAQVEAGGEVIYPQEDQVAIPILRTTQDTLFKRRPLQSSQLSQDDLYSVEPNQAFTLHSYAHFDSLGDFSSHIKFALRYQQDYIRGLSTWYVYDQHAYVEFDGNVVYPPEDPNTPTLIITQDTLFKRRPEQSSSLPQDDVYRVPKGTTLKLHSYAYANASGQDFNGHVKVALKYEKDYIKYLSTWYVYKGHLKIERNGTIVYPPQQPSPSPAPPTYTGKSFKLPGNVSTFYTDQPIIPGGSFTWGEATKNATRIPSDVSIVDNIIALARQLQKARNQIGRPFRVNSWYRPPAVNQAVGGASRSYHLYGMAVDLEVSGYSGRRLANAVMPWWTGGVGIYSNIPDIVHLDIGPKRMWGF